MPVLDSYPNATPGPTAEFVYKEGTETKNATPQQIVEAASTNVPTSDQKASFPAGASGADPLALASDPRFPTTDEKASFPAGASALVPLVLTNDPRIGDVNNFYGILVTDPSPLPINGTWIRQTTREVAFSPDGEMVYVAGTTASPSIIPAFPGAQGYGTSTPGGSGRHLATPTTTVYRVNTIADNNDAPVAVGDGTYRCSFRAAVGAEGPRVVVFEVSGRIDLASMITITEPYLTIAGQTAPAPGVTLYGNGFKINTHDVVIQHIRSRANYNDPDQVEGPMLLVGSDVSNVVIDHCSLGWAPDENVTFWASAGTSVRDNTISNCIIHESLVTGNPGQDGYGMIFGKNNPATIGPISALRNLMISNKTRNPLYKGGASAIFANNVVYNAALGAFVLFSDDYEGGAARATVTKNVFKDGPSGSPGGFLWFSADSIDDGSTIYVGSGGPSSADTDNVYKTTAGAVASFPLLEGGSAVPPAGYWVGTPDDAVWISGISLTDPASLETSVLSSAGARPAERGGAGEDANDARLIAEYQTGTGAIPSTGYFFPDPTIANNSAAFSLPADPDTVQLSGYTALEETLHTLAATVEGVDPPTYQTAYVPSVTTATPRVVATLTALQLIDGTSGQIVYLAGRTIAGDGGEGHFRWVTGNQSANVTADTQSGVWVAGTDGTGAGGAWKRQYSDELSPGWFGSNTTPGTTDMTTAMQACLDFAADIGGSVKGRKEAYNISRIKIKNGVKSVDLSETTLIPSGVTVPANLTTDAVVVLAGLLTGEAAPVSDAYLSFTIDMQNGDRTAILGDGTVDTTIENCRIYGFTNDATHNHRGIRLQEGASRNHIVNNYLEGVNTPTRRGLMIDVWASLTGLTDFGGFLTGTAVRQPTPAVGNIISGNTVINGSYAVNFQGAENNIFSNNFCDGQDHRSVYIANGSWNNIISDNQLINFLSTAILMGYVGSENIVTGNYCYSTNIAGQAAININTGSTGNVIKGNLIDSAANYGIYVGPDSSKNIVKENTLKNFYLAGIAVENDWIGTRPTNAIYANPSYDDPGPTTGTSLATWTHTDLTDIVIQGNTILEGYSGRLTAAIAVNQIQNSLVGATPTGINGVTIKQNTVNSLTNIAYCLYIYEHINGEMNNIQLIGNSWPASAAYVDFTGANTSTDVGSLRDAGVVRAEANGILDQKINSEPVTFTDGDTTPSVAGEWGYFATSNTAPTTITDFDGAENGKIIRIRLDGNTTIAYSSGLIRPKGLVNVSGGSTNNFIVFQQLSGVWFEISRSF